MGPSKAGGPASAGVILDMWEPSGRNPAGGGEGGGGGGGGGEGTQDEDLLSVLLLHGGVHPDLGILVFDHMEVRQGGKCFMHEAGSWFV